jgi:hypothetical protein
MHLSRYFVVAATCALLCSATASARTSRGGTANTAAAAASINPGAAARTCAGRNRASDQLGKVTAARLAALATCMLRTERSQLGLGYKPNAVISQTIGASLRRFVALPYLADGDSQAANQAEAIAAANARQAVCHTPTPGVSRVEWSFAEVRFPSLVTPLSVAKVLANELQPAGAVAQETAAVFGVAARRGRLFEHNNLDGTSLGVIAVACP